MSCDNTSIERWYVTRHSVTASATPASSTTIDKTGFTTGILHCVSGSVATITFEVTSETYAGSNTANSSGSSLWHNLVDSSGADITYTIVAGESCRLPLELAGARYFRIIGDVAGVFTVDLMG